MKQTRRHTFEILHGAGLAVVLRGMGAVLAFLLNIAIARIIGAEGAGFYFLALSVVSIGAVAAKLGLDNALLRFVADGASRGDWNSVIGVFRLGTRIAALSTLLTGIGVFALAPWIATALFGEPGLETPLRAISLGIFSFAMMMQMAECLRGAGQIGASVLVSGLIYPLTALILIWPMASWFGATGAAATYVLGTAASAAIGYLFWRRWADRLPASAPQFERAVLWRSSRPLWLMTLLSGALLPWMPVVLLGLWGTPADVGILGAATRIVMVLAILSQSMTTAMVPKYAELRARGDLRGIRAITLRSSGLVALITTPLVVAMIIFAPRILSIFGPEFAQGAAALAILALGQLLSALSVNMGYILLVFGRETDLRNGTIFAAAVMLASGLLLVPVFGMIGAAISASLGGASMNLANAVMVWRRFGPQLRASDAGRCNEGESS